jgi:hypothetical protein
VGGAIRPRPGYRPDPINNCVADSALIFRLSPESPRTIDGPNHVLAQNMQINGEKLNTAGAANHIEMIPKDTSAGHFPGTAGAMWRVPSLSSSLRRSVVWDSFIASMGGYTIYDRTRTNNSISAVARSD